jgi:hypothetical protein
LAQNNSKKHITLNEVLVVAVLFLTLLFTAKFLFNKFMESATVMSFVTYVTDEKNLIKQNISDTKNSIKNYIDNTEYNISDIAPWLNLKQRPLPVPEVDIENDAGASKLNEESVTNENLNPSINAKPEEIIPPAKN